MEPPNMTE